MNAIISETRSSEIENTESVTNSWSPNTVQLDIKLTDAAIKHIVKQINKRASSIGMHFGVKKSGCTGYTYVTDIIDKIEDDHTVKINDNLIITVDAASLPFVNGTTIDYVQEGLNRTFKFINPNEKVSCGCGESFSV